MASSGMSIGGNPSNRSGYPLWSPGMQDSGQQQHPAAAGNVAPPAPSNFPSPPNGHQFWQNHFPGYQHPNAMQYPPHYRPSSPMMNQNPYMSQYHPNPPGTWMMPPPHMGSTLHPPIRATSPHPPHSPMMDNHPSNDHMQHQHHHAHPHHGWEKFNPPPSVHQPSPSSMSNPYNSEPKRRKIDDVTLPAAHALQDTFHGKVGPPVTGARRMNAEIVALPPQKQYHTPQPLRHSHKPSPSSHHKSLASKVEQQPQQPQQQQQQHHKAAASQKSSATTFHKSPPNAKPVAVSKSPASRAPPASQPPQQQQQSPPQRKAAAAPPPRPSVAKQAPPTNSPPPTAGPISPPQKAPASTTSVTPSLKAKMLAIRDDEEAQLNFINEEQDRNDAERALASGDLSKAALHIGRALVKNTKRSDLVDRLTLAMKNHKSDILVALPNQPFHRSALQSFIYARLNKVPEAMVLLLLAYSEYCRIPIFNWLFDDWKVADSAIDEAIKRMPMDALRLPMLVVLKRHPQIAPSCVFEVNRFSSSQYEESKHSPSPNNPRDVSLLTSLKPFARFMLKVYNIRRSEFDSNATYFLATTLRKAGEFSQGLRLLEDLHAERPSWKTCIGIGYILREMGELEKAIDWFENASTFNPPNISFLLDAADTSLRVDQVPRARTHYLSILNAQPENSCADASVTYISFLMSGSEEHFGELLKMATKGNKRAKYLLKDALDVFKQFRVFLPDPCDCFVSAMQELRNYEYRPPEAAVMPSASIGSSANDAMDTSSKISSSSGIKVSSSVTINPDDTNKTTSTFDIEKKAADITSADATSASSTTTGGLAVGDLVSSNSDLNNGGTVGREPDSSQSDKDSVEGEVTIKTEVMAPGSLPDSDAQERIRLALSQTRDRQPLKSDEVRVAVSAIEAPSYSIVWRFLNKIYSMNFRFEVELTGDPMQGAPDPRAPAEPVAILTWKYSKIKPRPGLPAPKLLDVMRILQPISTIARTEFDVSRWMRQSERIAADILVPAFQVIEEPIARMLIGLMLHAENFFPLPETWGVPSGARHTLLIESGEKHAPVWTWIYSIFIVVTMVLASTLPSHLEENSLERWRASLQYKALHSLLMGPMDWIVDAAIIVLARLALDRTKPPFVEQEVCRLFLLRAQKTPTQGYVCYRKVLLCHLIMLPSVRPDQRLVWMKSLKKQM